jgi:D-serine deaminase-like pyridoxal phosphate-dependent protein
MRVDDLDTPFLMMDLDALEENLERYQAPFRGSSIGFRPHIKTHKSLAIARMQLERGAIGLTCQKLGEAEVLVDGGIRTDILITFNVIGKQKLKRLTALCKRTQVTIAADSEYTVRGLSEAAAVEGVTIGVIVEVDTGFERTGMLTPQDCVDLAKLVDTLPGLELRGFMGFPTAPDTRPIIQATLDLFRQAGLPHAVVSGGSTPNVFKAHQIPELTEYRAGEYAVGGAYHFHEGRHTLEQCALRVVTTVVSRPCGDRMFLDAGSKTLSASVYKRDGVDAMGHIVEYPSALLECLSEEHGHVNISSCDPKPEIGERLQVLPAHPCPCVNEHDEVVVVRKGKVEAVWPVEARGKIL